MAQTTLLDIVKANKGDREVGLIEEVIPAVPEIDMVPTRTIKGLNYPTLVRTGLPTVGFRNANEGSSASKSTYANRLVECFMMNPQWICDKAVADAYEDGVEAFIGMEAVAITKAAFITLGKQFYYGAGTNGDSKGHPGLIDAYDSTNMVVDAGGTTDNISTSVWAVKYGPQDVTWVLGNGGSFDVGDPRVQSVQDDSGNWYDAYIQSLLARPGLQVGSLYSVGRIKKLTTDSGKGLDDDKISDLLMKFPVGSKPDALFMSRRSLKQLQQSRTATNPTGQPAPFPSDAFGVPIVITDSILETELLAS